MASLRILKIWRVDKQKNAILPEGLDPSDLIDWRGDLEIEPGLGVVKLPKIKIAGSLRCGLKTNVKGEAIQTGGEIRMSGDLSLTGSLIAGGAVNLGGALEAAAVMVEKDLEAKSLWAGRSIQIGGDLTVGGSISTGGELRAGGNVVARGSGITAGRVIVGGDLSAPFPGPLRAVIDVRGGLEVKGSVKAGAVLLVHGEARIGGDAVTGHGFNIMGGDLIVGGSIISPQGGFTAANVQAGREIALGQGFKSTGSVIAGWGLNAKTTIQAAGRIQAGREIKVEEDIIVGAILRAGFFIEAANVSSGALIEVGGAAREERDREVRATVLRGAVQIAKPQDEAAAPAAPARPMTQKELAQKAMAMRAQGSFRRTG